MNPSISPSAPPPLRPSHSGLATASLICGILTLPTCYAAFLPAIIMGHIAWSRAGRDGGDRGRAKLGLIFGYASLALLPVIAAIAGLTAPLIIRQRERAELAECKSHSLQIGLALMEYESDHGEFPPDLKQLETDGLTPSVDRLLSMHTGYDGEWLYFPKASTRNPSSPLLISPPVGKSRLVLRVDGSVSKVYESDMRRVTPDDPPVRIPVPPRTAR